MSGIYIKGIDVPKEGTVIVIDSTGQVWSNEWPTRGYTRIDGAKAVSVPPHGRLKDYDRIMKDYDEWFSKTESREYENMFYALRMAINGSPTIIPAEEGKQEAGHEGR